MLDTRWPGAYDLFMERNSVRFPAVAGRFYPRTRDELLRELDRYLEPQSAAEETLDSALACIVPHAGYMYSGHVAGAVYRLLPSRTRYVILGPNHWGRGAALAVMSAGTWLTPLGEVSVDTELARNIQENCPRLAEDGEAHSREHSLEVQLPFLQRLSWDFRFVPIAIGQADYSLLAELGHAVAIAVRHSSEPVLIVASSDMNHYEPDGVTREKDEKAIEKILQLDPEGMLEVIRNENISMCGFAPVATMLIAAKELGARQARLVQHATSADTGGDAESVVGYAGITII